MPIPKNHLASPPTSPVDHAHSFSSDVKMEDFAHCAAAEDGFRSSSPLFKSDDREHHPMINSKVV